MKKPKDLLEHICLILVFVGITGCSSSGSVVAECPFRESLGLTEEMDCGLLEVPEDHDVPDGPKISIAYVVLKAKKSGSGKYPIVLFTGGPGGYSLVKGQFDGWLDDELRKERDIIFFDQRGINLSSGLPNLEEAIQDVVAADYSSDEEIRAMKEAFRQFSEQMKEEGRDLSNYNSFQNARDVGALMNHLGYEKYNLVGGSYGTRLARIVQNMFPELVNGVILNSPNPLGGDLLISRLEAYSLSLSRIFDYCASTDGCNDAYPDLKKVYLESVAWLSENPLTIAYSKGNYVVNPQDAIYIIRRALYRTDARERIPALIYAFSNQDKEPIKEIIEGDVILNSNYNSSMWLAVERHEMFDPRNTPGVIDSIYETYELFPDRLGLFNACYLAGAYLHDNVLPIGGRRFDPSDLPTLVFVNHYDPVTPPEDGHRMLEDLNRSMLFIMDEGGHGGGDMECKTQVVKEFLDDVNRKPDHSCLNLYSPVIVKGY